MPWNVHILWPQPVKLERLVAEPVQAHHGERDVVRPPVAAEIELGRAALPADLPLCELPTVLSGGAHHLDVEAVGRLSNPWAASALPPASAKP